MTGETENEGGGKLSSSPVGASPKVASILAGIAGVLWAQAIIRYLEANMSLELWNIILPEKSADIMSIWLASIFIGLSVFAAAYVVFRKRKRVGSVRVWIVILLVSAIIRYL